MFKLFKKQNLALLGILLTMVSLTPNSVYANVEGQKVLSFYGGGGPRECGKNGYCHGAKMACDGRFNMNAMKTVAHKSLPCGTKVRVTVGSKSLVMTVKDRGPYTPGRDYDLPRAAAEYFGFRKRGTTVGAVEVLGRTSKSQRSLKKSAASVNPVYLTITEELF